MPVPVAVSTFATLSVEGQRARPSGPVRFEGLKAVDSTPGSAILRAAQGVLVHRQADRRRLDAGVQIGSRALIGAGSMVTRDVPEGVFAAGNPCRVIRSAEGG